MAADFSTLTSWEMMKQTKQEIPEKFDKLKQLLSTPS
jgi:hypothetical protein